MRGTLILLLSVGFWGTAWAEHAGESDGGGRPSANPNQLAGCVRAICGELTTQNNFGRQNEKLIETNRKRFAEISKRVEEVFQANYQSTLKSVKDWMKTVSANLDELDKPVDKRLNPYVHLQMVDEFYRAESQAMASVKTEEEAQRVRPMILKYYFPLLSDSQREALGKMVRAIEEKPYANLLLSEDPRKPHQSGDGSLESRVANRVKKTVERMGDLRKKFPEFLEASPDIKLLAQGNDPLLVKALREEPLNSSDLYAVNYALFRMESLLDVYLNPKNNREFHHAAPRPIQAYGEKSKEVIESRVPMLESDAFKEAVSAESKMCASRLLNYLSRLPTPAQRAKARADARKARENVRTHWLAKVSEKSRKHLNINLDAHEYRLPPTAEEFEQSFLNGIKGAMEYLAAFDASYKKTKSTPLAKQVDLAALLQRSTLEPTVILEQVVAGGCVEPNGLAWMGTDHHDRFNRETKETIMSADVARNPDATAAVCMHEYGHAADPYLVLPKDRIQISDFTLRKTSDIKKCLASQHSEHGEYLVDEDFADLIESKAKSKVNTECFYVPAGLLEKPTPEMIQSYVNPQFPHSASLFRLVSRQFLRTGSVPAACAPFAKAGDGPGELKNCF